MYKPATSSRQSTPFSFSLTHTHTQPHTPHLPAYTDRPTDDGFTTMYMIVYWGEQGLFLAVNEVFEETFTSADRMRE